MRNPYPLAHRRRRQSVTPAGEGSVTRRVWYRVQQDAIALLRPPWRAVRTGQWHRFWLGPAAATAVLILSQVAGTRSGQAFLRNWAIMRGNESWWLTLRKVPLSLLKFAHLRRPSSE